MKNLLQTPNFEVCDVSRDIYILEWCSPRCSSLPSSSGLLTCFSVEVYGMCTGLQRQTICCRFTSSNTDQHLGWITCATLIIFVFAVFDDCIPSCPQMKIITAANVMQMKRVPHHCVSHKLCLLLRIPFFRLTIQDPAMPLKCWAIQTKGNARSKQLQPGTPWTRRRCAETPRPSARQITTWNPMHKATGMTSKWFLPEEWMTLR
jgi:hypothetical protein